MNDRRRYNEVNKYFLNRVGEREKARKENQGRRWRDEGRFAAEKEEGQRRQECLVEEQ
jgi:hypothetical protein